MFVSGLPKLLGQVLERAFGQDVDDFAAAGDYPVHGLAAVHEAQHLDPVEVSFGGSPLANAGESLRLSLGDPGGSDFDTVNLEFLQKQLGDGQFLAAVERDTSGLLAVTKSSVEYL